MAIFNVTTGGSSNLPPTQVGNITINLEFNESYVFTIDDFTTLTTPNYSDPEGDSVQSIKILNLPLYGKLLLSGVFVGFDQEIALAEITSGNLTYTADALETGGYTDSLMIFNIADDGSGLYGSITPGVVTFTVKAQANLPPSSVGDLEINLTYGEFLTFTRANFTTETTPPYFDPEGDPPLNLKIISLPITGTLKHNAIPVTVNQVIPFADIDLGKLTYSPNVLITTAQDLTFDFAISDTGSLQYSS